MFFSTGAKHCLENAFWRILPANFTLSLVIEWNSDNNFVHYGKYDLPRSDRNVSPVFVRDIDGFLSPRDENKNGSQIKCSRKTVFQMPSFYLKVNEQSRKLPSPSFEQVSDYLSLKSLKNNEP